MKKRGFTLIEIVITTLILGILAAVALPYFFSFRQEAQKATEDTIIASVQGGIQIYRIESATTGRLPVFPLTLDDATSSPAGQDNPFFIHVLQLPGITDSAWLKLGDTLYQAPSGEFYAYEPTTGNFAKYYGGKTIASGGGVYTFIPAKSADPYSNSQWAAWHGGLYSPWSGTPLNFTFNFEGGGNFKFDFSAINNANHPDFTAGLGQPERTNWHLPSGYDRFYVDVAIDGTPASPEGFSILASDTQINSNSLITHVDSGAHTISLTWTNDMWTPDEQGDANIEFQTITVQGQP